MIKVIDVSHWQGTIDWTKVAADGVKGAFIKASEGMTYVDPQFRRNALGADAVGLKVGFYHFLRVDNTDPVAEAKHFVDTIKPMKYEWLVCDVESAKGKNTAHIVDYTQRWLKEVERLTGKKPIVYTYLSFANSHLGDKFISYPLWLAHYGVTTPGKTKWADWVCWQYSDKGKVNGIGGYVDMNHMKPEFFEPPVVARQPKTPFTDVPAGHWAEDDIEWCRKNGYLVGKSATVFDPEGPVTRAQMASIIRRLKG